MKRHMPDEQRDRRAADERGQSGTPAHDPQPLHGRRAEDPGEGARRAGTVTITMAGAARGLDPFTPSF